MLNHLNRPYVNARSNQLLDDFGLSDAAHRTAKTYSGGMRRRLDLAASLVADPPILSSTNPRRDSTHKAVRTSGPLSKNSWRVAPPCCSRRSISRRLTGSPNNWAQLKASMGTTVLTLTFASTDDAARAIAIVADLSDQPINHDGTILEMTVNNGPVVHRGRLTAP